MIYLHTISKFFIFITFLSFFICFHRSRVFPPQYGLTCASKVPVSGNKNVFYVNHQEEVYTLDLGEILETVPITLCKIIKEYYGVMTVSPVVAEILFGYPFRFNYPNPTTLTVGKKESIPRGVMLQNNGNYNSPFVYLPKVSATTLLHKLQQRDPADFVLVLVVPAQAKIPPNLNLHKDVLIQLSSFNPMKAVDTHLLPARCTDMVLDTSSNYHVAHLPKLMCKGFFLRILAVQGIQSLTIITHSTNRSLEEQKVKAMHSFIMALESRGITFNLIIEMKTKQKTDRSLTAINNLLRFFHKNIYYGPRLFSWLDAKKYVPRDIYRLYNDFSRKNFMLPALPSEQIARLLGLVKPSEVNFSMKGMSLEAKAMKAVEKFTIFSSPYHFVAAANQRVPHDIVESPTGGSKIIFNFNDSLEHEGYQRQDLNNRSVQKITEVTDQSHPPDQIQPGGAFLKWRLPSLKKVSLAVTQQNARYVISFLQRHPTVDTVSLKFCLFPRHILQEVIRDVVEVVMTYGHTWTRLVFSESFTKQINADLTSKNSSSKSYFWGSLNISWKLLQVFSIEEFKQIFVGINEDNALCKLELNSTLPDVKSLYAGLASDVSFE